MRQCHPESYVCRMDTSVGVLADRCLVDFLPHSVDFSLNASDGAGSRIAPSLFRAIVCRHFACYLRSARAVSVAVISRRPAGSFVVQHDRALGACLNDSRKRRPLPLASDLNSDQSVLLVLIFSVLYPSSILTFIGSLMLFYCLTHPGGVVCAGCCRGSRRIAGVMERGLRIRSSTVPAPTTRRRLAPPACGARSRTWSARRLSVFSSSSCSTTPHSVFRWPEQRGR